MSIRYLERVGLIAVATILFSMALTLSASSPASASQPRCTIKGTKGPDRLVGTPGRDVICGFGGKDVLVGRGGNDVLRGGKGDDLIKGGSGNDRLLGQPNNDQLFAGPGNDYLDGGKGRNVLISGPGNNKCINRETDTRTPGCDDQAPEFTEVSVDRSSVDTSAGPQSVKVTVRVTDDLAGLDGAPSLSVIHSKTNQTRRIGFRKVSGDEMDSVWEGTLALPRFAPAGRYGFYLNADDRQGNFTTLYPHQATERGFPSGIDQTGEGDSSGPRFESFAVDKTTIDTSASSQTINFTTRITDDISGVDPDAFLHPGRITLENDAADSYREANLELVSGTYFDGIYEGSVTFPRYTPAGTWKIAVITTDKAGNWNRLNTEDLAARSLPSTVTQTAPGDSNPPTLRSVTVPSDPLVISGYSEPVVATFRVTDDMSGVGVGGLGMSVLTAEGGNAVWIKQISGTDLDGIYEATSWVWEGAFAPGFHGLDIGMSDEAGNHRFYGQDDLNALGFDSEVEFVSAP